jgi:hypothetical protein
MTTRQTSSASRLRDELEPNVLPRQLRALEQVAARLVADRPPPAAPFRAQLDARIREVGVRTRGGAPWRWRLGAAICLVLGLALLAVAAILAAQLGTAG